MAIPSITFGDAIFFSKKEEESFSYDCYSLAERYLSFFSDRVFQCTEISAHTFDVKNITLSWRADRNPWEVSAILASYLLVIPLILALAIKILGRLEVCESLSPWKPQIG